MSYFSLTNPLYRSSVRESMRRRRMEDLERRRKLREAQADEDDFVRKGGVVYDYESALQPKPYRPQQSPTAAQAEPLDKAKAKRSMAGRLAGYFGAGDLSDEEAKAAWNRATWASLANSLSQPRQPGVSPWIAAAQSLAGSMAASGESFEYAAKEKARAAAEAKEDAYVQEQRRIQAEEQRRRELERKREEGEAAARELLIEQEIAALPPEKQPEAKSWKEAGLYDDWYKQYTGKKQEQEAIDNFSSWVSTADLLPAERQAAERLYAARDTKGLQAFVDSYEAERMKEQRERNDPTTKTRVWVDEDGVVRQLVVPEPPEKPDKPPQYSPAEERNWIAAAERRALAAKQAAEPDPKKRKDIRLTEQDYADVQERGRREYAASLQRAGGSAAPQAPDPIGKVVAEYRDEYNSGGRAIKAQLERELAAEMRAQGADDVEVDQALRRLRGEA